ncbi:iron-containing alcohol dehydrogenase [Bradyrhizobium cenepequi]
MQMISSFFCPTRIYMGPSSYRQLPGFLDEYRCKRLFVAMDAALRETEFAKSVLALLADGNIGVSIFTEIEPDPSVGTVEKAFAQCLASEATAILAVGGGSTIDVAKAVGILSTNGGRIHDYEGIERFKTPPLPLIAIPTTAGTGSEVSGSCVITDTERGLKMSIRHASLNPARIAILDPLALRTIPPTVACHAGVDAFVHAFESFIARNANPFTDAVNIDAIRLIAANIRPFVANPANEDAALNMLCGSALAGMAFGQTGLGNVHCMSRFIGARFHLSHGLSNALCLPTVARFNMIANPGKYARVAAAMGCHVAHLPELEAARIAVEKIAEMCVDLGIPARLREVGVTQDSLEEMAQLCTEANYNRWNPRFTSTADFVALFRQAY